MEPNYYHPDEGLVKYLQSELDSRINEDAHYSGGKSIVKKRVRDPKRRNKIASEKTKYLNKIFQSYANLLYFVEFIERNYEALYEVYEHDLADMFGFNYYENDSFSGFHERPLYRLISSMVLDKQVGNESFNKFDFRLDIIIQLLDISLKSISYRMEDEEDRDLFRSDLRRLRFWVKILSKQLLAEKRRPAKRRMETFENSKIRIFRQND